MYHHRDTTKQRRIYYLPRLKGEPALPKKLTLSKAIEGFLLACRARRLSEHTLTDYSRTLTRFLAHVGDSPIADIRPEQINAFLVAQPFSEKTLLNYHIGLSALWTWAVKNEYTPKHIMRLVEKPKPQKMVVEPFSEIEVRALMTGIRRNTDRDRAIILLLLDTGMRASEMCGIELANIDLTTNKVKVLGKGNKERLMPFSARTASALFKHINNLEGGKPFPFNRTSLAHLLQLIGRRAGVNKCHPHRFRHTFAINYIRNGGDPYTLQDILGHSQMEMVRRYLAIAQIDLESAHKRASPVENWKL